MMRRSKNTFYCFSPPVMIATLCVESVLTIYTIWRYQLSHVSKLVIGTLLALATFQLSEYHVCTGYGLTAEDWSRLGFVSITMLPALGMHLIHVLADKPQRRMVGICYVTMVAFMIYFLSYHAAFIGYQCTGNYVIFQIGLRTSIAYAVYYYGWLVTALILGGRWLNKFAKQEGNDIVRRMQTVKAMMIGYLVFLVPTALANSVKPSTRRGIPSIMCGFAVLFALILVLYVLPRAAEKRTTGILVRSR